MPLKDRPLIPISKKRRSLRTTKITTTTTFTTTSKNPSKSETTSSLGRFTSSNSSNTSSSKNEQKNNASEKDSKSREIESKKGNQDTGGTTTTTTKKKSKKKTKGKLCCDKCDGSHATNDCIFFERERGTHPDEKKGKGKGLGDGSGGNYFTRNGKVIRQPGDGSCLFHSMAYGLRGTSARALRKNIAQWIGKNGSYVIADSPLSDWVKWESSSSVSSYARRMAGGNGWGGAIEMAACSRLKGVNVHVYERARGGFKRISCFNVNGATRTIHVLYGGRVHYDALVL